MKVDQIQNHSRPASENEEIVSWLCVRLMRAVPANLAKILAEAETEAESPEAAVAE